MRTFRILVLGTDARRTGAPVALLRSLGPLVESGQVRPMFLLRCGGDLLAEYQALGPVLQIPAWPERRGRQVAERLGVRGAYSAAFAAYREALHLFLKRRCRAWGVETIFANTVMHGDLLAALGRTGLPVVCHAHETGRFMDRNLGADEVEALLSHVDRWLAVSAAVARDLAARGVAPARVSIVPGAVPAPEPLAAEAVTALRASLGAAPGELLAVGCGTPAWEKGTDLFVDVALRMSRDAPARRLPVRTAWVGATRTSPYGRLMFEDVELAGLDGSVTLLPPRPDAERLVGAADVFASTSRADALPLVVLEAASHGRPFVCFERAGGTEDLVSAGAGIAVPYLDTAAFSGAVMDLLEDPVRAAATGEAGQAWVRSHCDPATVGNAIVSVLGELS